MLSLFGPYSQLITMDQISLRGPINDVQLNPIIHGGILVNDSGQIQEVGIFKDLIKVADKVFEETSPSVALPSWIDSHTHLVFGGNRAKDYALRVSGHSYMEILESGGGINDTVRSTRQSTDEILKIEALNRINKMIEYGITTVEIKSGYGLSVEEEFRLLNLIENIKESSPITIIPTCLAAHIVPKEELNAKDYLQKISNELLPKIIKKLSCRRIDIFIEDHAFSADLAEPYIFHAQKMGFDATIHADQFTLGSAILATKIGAISADHLEAANETSINALSQSGTVATVLPGASIGLGMQFAPARKLLDAGCIVSIASDWNPGSAPMGHLPLQAFILGTFEKITLAETFAGMTFRAAHALKLSKTGILKKGNEASWNVFPVKNYQEIGWYQGLMYPTSVWKKGKKLI